MIARRFARGPLALRLKGWTTFLRGIQFPRIELNIFSSFRGDNLFPVPIVSPVNRNHQPADSDFVNYTRISNETHNQVN